jgi:hypothetical protein
MARVKSSGLSRAQLSALGSVLSYEQTQEDDGVGSFQGLAGFGDVATPGLAGGMTTRPSITGIDAVDRMLYSVEDQLATFKLAMTITTVSSLAAAMASIILILDSGRRG